MTYWIVTMDEKGRITIPNTGLKCNPHGLGQGISHTYSYLYCREAYQAMGDKMGLELDLDQKCQELSEEYHEES